MPTESFRELNRRRREQNAFEHLREYAATRGLSDPEGAAREAAEKRHAAARQGTGSGGAGSVVAPAGRSAEQKSTGKAAAAEGTGGTEKAPAAEGTRTAEKSAAAERPRKDEEAEGSSPVPHRLEDRTKEQLYTRAQELEVEGRSQMTKEELIEAIRAKQ